MHAAVTVVLEDILQAVVQGQPIEALVRLKRAFGDDEFQACLEMYYNTHTHHNRDQGMRLQKVLGSLDMFKYEEERCTFFGALIKYDLADCVRFLLEHAADSASAAPWTVWALPIEKQDTYENNALALAAFHGSSESLQVILGCCKSQKDKLIKAKNKFKETALKLAEDRENHRCLSLLCEETLEQADQKRFANDIQPSIVIIRDASEQRWPLEDFLCQDAQAGLATKVDGANGVRITALNFNSFTSRDHMQGFLACMMRAPDVNFWRCRGCTAPQLAEMLRGAAGSISKRGHELMVLPIECSPPSSPEEADEVLKAVKSFVSFMREWPKEPRPHTICNHMMVKVLERTLPHDKAFYAAVFAYSKTLPSIFSTELQRRRKGRFSPTNIPEVEYLHKAVDWTSPELAHAWHLEYATEILNTQVAQLSNTTTDSAEHEIASAYFRRTCDMFKDSAGLFPEIVGVVRRASELLQL